MASIRSRTDAQKPPLLNPIHPLPFTHPFSSIIALMDGASLAKEGRAQGSQTPTFACRVQHTNHKQTIVSEE